MHLPALLFLTLLPPLSATPCQTTAHCRNPTPALHPICLPPLQLCAFISTTESPPPHPKSLTLTTLPNLQSRLPPLSHRDKLHIINASRHILANLNSNLFLQHSLYSYNVLTALDTLQTRLPTRTFPFHRQMQSIFSRMNDRHSTYISPSPLSSSFAFLGFFITAFHDVNPTTTPTPRYVVYDVPSIFAAEFINTSTTFRKGAEVTTWNGVYIADAVLQSGRQGFGSNQAAQAANGVLQLTFRILALDSVPLESSVRVGYRTPEGVDDVVEVPWRFLEERGGMTSDAVRVLKARAERHPLVRNGNILRDSYQGVAVDHRQTDSLLQGGVPLSFRSVENRTRIPVSPRFESLFAAEIIQTKVGAIGRLILPSFNSTVTPALTSELARVLKLMPENGLVLDARKNLGGQADYAKKVIELVSDVDVPDQSESIRATELVASLFLSDVDGNQVAKGEDENNVLDLLPKALATALQVSADFTAPFIKLWPASQRLDRVYFGPIITVVDGLTYSAGDIFAALQVDLNVSLLVGTSDNVGAGGASTIAYSILAEVIPELKPLPQDVDFFTASTRFYRTGEELGAVVENFGVKPDIRYYPTLDDALYDDCDLFEFLAGKLASVLK